MLRCNIISKTWVDSKMTTTKREERVEEETTQLSTSNSSKVGHPNWEAKASPSVFKDSNSKLEESIPPHLVADGPTKPQAVAGAEALLNLVDGKEVRIHRCTYEERYDDEIPSIHAQ
mmetsp:Transcript_3578/g.7418  ORF Transcript_3578/g.7418 Transcript_3578/m.7418 type:complete len:117 (+) Transcript_3578:2123-2473(+)